MNIEEKKVIFTSKDEGEVNKAADYLKECQIECLVEKSADKGLELAVEKKNTKKANKLLDDFFGPNSKTEDDADWEDEKVVKSEGSGYGVMGILGVVLLVVTIALAAIGYAQNWAQVKLINIILVSLTLLVNGYVGIIQRKSLGTVICILSLIGLLFVIIKPGPKPVSQSRMTVAMTYMNKKDYPAALQHFETALEAARAEKDVQSEAFILSYMANIFKERNLIDRSLEYYDMASKLFIDSGLEDTGKIIELEVEKIKQEYGK